jgi:hypothetical protein
VLPPHAWPQSMHAAREWVTMLALWSRRNLSGYGADTFQGPLVPHCRFQRWRTISVRVVGVVHVNDSVETHRPRASHQTALTIFHPCTSFRTLSLTYAMMGSRTSMEPKHQVRRTQGRFPAVMENNPKLRIIPPLLPVSDMQDASSTAGLRRRGRASVALSWRSNDSSYARVSSMRVRMQHTTRTRRDCHAVL